MRHNYTIDMRLFAQCRTCCEPMIGILSIKTREDCRGCGGSAMNINNENPSSPEEFARKANRLRGYPLPYTPPPTTPHNYNRRA